VCVCGGGGVTTRIGLLGTQRVHDMDIVREEVNEAITKGWVGRVRAKKKSARWDR
jgi:hypothetical protein